MVHIENSSNIVSENPADSVIFISSSDEEETNEDLSLEILEGAVAKEVNKNTEDDNEVILVNSSPKDSEANVKNSKMKIKRKIKTGKNGDESVVDAVAEVPKDEDIVGEADYVVTKVTEVNEIPDNSVMRKLLRGPRYFDPDEKDSSACFNCGNEGHTAVNCTMAKKKRPCFVCGMFGHNPWHCTQGQDCFICKRRGHIAKNCPDKKNHAPQDSRLCLRCGDFGHDMLSCKNDYAPGDLKGIQCYICKNHGHFCCVDFVVDGPREVYCYNCAQPGHTGLSCGKLNGINHELVDAPPTLCYKCGKEGHFARGCTKRLKNGKQKGGSSTPRKRKDRRKKDRVGSAPAELGKSRKKRKGSNHNDNSNTTATKARVRSGWTVDGPGNLPTRKQISNKNWNSPPSTHRTLNVPLPASLNSNVYQSTPRTPFERHSKPFVGTPNSNTPTSTYHRHHYSYNAPTSSYHNPRYSYNAPTSSYQNPQYNCNTPTSSYHGQQFSHAPPSSHHNQRYSYTPNSSYRPQQFGYTPRPSYDNSRNYF